MNKKPSLSRRKFLKDSALLAGVPFLAKPEFLRSNFLFDTLEPATLFWLVKPDSPAASGLTWGVPWPKGKYKASDAFYLRDDQGNKYALQSWPLAYWPDGSLKWTAHAAAPGLPNDSSYAVIPGKFESNASKLNTVDGAEEIIIDTGKLRCTISKKGNELIKSLSIKDVTIAENGRLTLLVQNQPDDANEGTLTRQSLEGKISEVSIEQRGPLRSVIKISGEHVGKDLKLLPFVLRLYFYAGSDEIRMLHTIIYNADEQRHFIKGMGLSIELPLKDELYNRHIRFVNSEDEGIFGEAVKTLTGLRRNPGREITQAQIEGKTVGAGKFAPEIGRLLKYIPSFGDYTLSQINSSAFSIRKRTTSTHSWVEAASGKRALGTAYFGTPKGGLVAGIRHFWQSFPSQVDIRDAATDRGKMNLWFWAPDAPAMDLRFYHDGMGQDNYEKQREGLEITYEDYEPGFGTPEGVARTSELVLKVVEATPSRQELVTIANAIEEPPRLICDHRYLEQQKVFGGNWSVEDRAIPAKEALEQQLQTFFEYYKKQVDYHNWYGYWNFGDFMHSYDPDRHTWRYDVGGFAWDNSELSTDLWLWYYYLKTQRADAFHMAEAMTRHTGEVDVHHIGKFAPLGSRHNVMHWGDSAKQLRISTAANRRFYYYLTADERTGDLLKEQVDAAKTLSRIQPNRKLEGVRDRQQPQYSETKIPASFGTDYGAIAAAWLTEWERTGNPQIKQRLINSMNTIAAQPHGFFTGAGILDLISGKFEISTDNRLNVSHLNAVFGLTEIVEELLNLLHVPAFEKAWLQYCRLYNAPPEEQQKELGQPLSRLNLGQGHSRLTAYAAYRTNDRNLAARAWEEFYSGRAGIKPGPVPIKEVKGPATLNKIEEAITISTNGVAQWGLAAIQCLAYIGEHIPATKP